jgi:hypothetical protein
MKGRIDLMSPAMAIQKELMSVPSFDNGEDELLSAEKKAIANAKKAILMIAGSAVQKLMQKLKDEQEIIMNVTDMMIELFACESAYLRIMKLSKSKTGDELQPYIDMTQIYINEAIEKINLYGKHAITAFAEGDELKMLLLGLKRFTKLEPVNTVKLRRNVADKLIEANKFCF